ncbi:hypothetical protein COO60DRAFT_1003068 [Scenedesmus sp. NREL 46B-D3]|nr:hypothetical protein COO60DRAFT_1003068 [Scenedesmus sp. NREL 46B-D3]
MDLVGSDIMGGTASTARTQQQQQEQQQDQQHQHQQQHHQQQEDQLVQQQQVCHRCMGPWCTAFVKSCNLCDLSGRRSHAVTVRMRRSCRRESAVQTLWRLTAAMRQPKHGMKTSRRALVCLPTVCCLALTVGQVPEVHEDPRYTGPCRQRSHGRLSQHSQPATQPASQPVAAAVALHSTVTHQRVKCSIP